MSLVGGLYLSALLRRFSIEQLDVRSVGVDDEQPGDAEERDPPSLVAAGERVDRLADDVIEDLRLDVRLRSRAEAGQQQQVLDDPEEPLRILGDVGDHRPPSVLAQGVALVAEDLGVAEDRRDRGSQLVRHEAEELVLHRVRSAQRLGIRDERVLGLAPIGDVDQDVDRPDQARRRRRAAASDRARTRSDSRPAARRSPRSRGPAGSRGGRSPSGTRRGASPGRPTRRGGASRTTPRRAPAGGPRTSRRPRCRR